MRPFVLIIMSGWSAGAVSAVSCGLRLLFDDNGLMMTGWKQRAAGGLFLLWATPAAVAIIFQACCFGGRLLRRAWFARRARQAGPSEEDRVPLTNGEGTAEGRVSPPASVV